MRGLDYYTRTVFEWITGSAGAQNAVCSGGRYDGLIAQLGGEATPGGRLCHGRGAPGGAARGRRRHAAARRTRTCTWWSAARGASAEALQLVERLRSERPRLRLELNLGGGNFKAQFRRADKSGAPLALIIGEDELARGVVGDETFARASRVRPSARSGLRRRGRGLRCWPAGGAPAG